jgi:mRNA interferase RelE/StbE
VNHRILVRPEARTSLLSLPTPVRRPLQHAIDTLAARPHPPHAVAVTGQPNTFRIRVADHHVVYAVQEGEVLILVIDAR